jgi:hypothetical protein
MYAWSLLTRLSSLVLDRIAGEHLPQSLLGFRSEHNNHGEDDFAKKGSKIGL